MKKILSCIFVFFFLLFVSSRLVLSQISKIDETCPAGMISYWKLDEFGGVNTFLDSYGGHNGFTTDLTRPAEDSGVVNQARKFNSKSEINIPDNNDFNWGAHTDFSIELWIKTTQPGTGTKVFIGRTGNTKMTWWLGYGDDNKVIFFVKDSSGSFTQLVGNSIINDGTWHYIVAIRDDNIKVLQIFIDGKEDGKISTFFSGDFSATAPINIGHYTGDFHFSGLLDEIGIYNVALSTTIISKHYNDGVQGKGYCDQFTGINTVDNLPLNFSLSQNYPNPFNPDTNIKFDLPDAENVRIDVYNILGEKVSTLLNKTIEAGFHQVEFNGSNLSSGTYIYRIEAGDFVQSKRMVLLK